jgi:hypothetical protein
LCATMLTTTSKEKANDIRVCVVVIRKRQNTKYSNIMINHYYPLSIYYQLNKNQRKTSLYDWLNLQKINKIIKSYVRHE